MAFKAKVVFTTSRLAVQEAELNDAPFFFQLLNSPNWLEHIGDRGIKSIADAEQYIQKSLIDSYQQHGMGLYKMVLQETRQPIGICGLVNRPGLDHPDIGFAILPEFAGKGYTFEAAEATMQYAKHQLQLSTILAITTTENIASRKLLEKIGLKEKGTIQFKEDGPFYLKYSSY